MKVEALHYLVEDSNLKRECYHIKNKNSKPQVSAVTGFEAAFVVTRVTTDFVAILTMMNDDVETTAISVSSGEMERIVGGSFRSFTSEIM